MAQAPDQRLSAIEAQIRALQDELRRVKHDLAARDGQVRAAQQQANTARSEAQQAQAIASQPTPAQPVSASPPLPPPVGAVSFPQNRPTLTSADGHYSLAIGLQLHYDVGGYFQGTHPSPDNRSVNRLDDFGQNLRRARIPVVFKAGDFTVNLTPDFGGSPDGSPTVYQATVGYNGIKNTNILLGYYKPELTLGDSQSSNDFLFLERPSIVEIARNIAAGDARAVFGANTYGDRYFVAAYLTGGTYASQNPTVSTGQQTGAALRVAGRPVATNDVDLLLGVSASDAFRLNRTSTGETIELRDRPELRIDQNRLIDTGVIQASGAYEYGGEVAVRYRNLFLQGEYIQMNVNRIGVAGNAGAPHLLFDGGYAEASYIITGEPRRYDPAVGAFTRPRPAEPFSLKDGHFGAVEVAARYSVVDLDSHVSRGIAASVSGGVFGGRQQVYSAGVNWYPMQNLRFMLDYDRIEVDRLDTTGTKQIGQKLHAVALRAQAAF